MAYKYKNYTVVNEARFSFVEDKYQDLKYREIFELKGRKYCEVIMEADKIYKFSYMD